MATIGDPAGMRASSTQLRFRAERMAQLAAQVDAHVLGMSYSGPAANRWRAAINDQSSRLRITASRLEATADGLLQDATLVEETQTLERLIGGL